MEFRTKMAEYVICQIDPSTFSLGLCYDLCVTVISCTDRTAQFNILTVADMFLIDFVAGSEVKTGGSRSGGGIGLSDTADSVDCLKSGRYGYCVDSIVCLSLKLSHWRF